MGAFDYGLEFLLAFNGRIHHLEKGYWLKFEIERVDASEARPHGLSYSFTLHAPDGTRLVGFDNAHPPQRRSKFKHHDQAADHWHRMAKDAGRPYRFVNAQVLLDDFFNEVERVLQDRGIALDVISDDTERSK